MGKDATLILVDGDPATTISNIRKISLVMKSGAVHFPADIYTAQGVKPFAEATVLREEKVEGR